MKEIWKPVVGYENTYEVSNLGNVRSLDRYVANRAGVKTFVKGKQLAPIKNTYGYLRVNLCNDTGRKSYFIHRLVAVAFLKNPKNLPQINHKDEIKTNNIVSNLEWCDAKYNINYGGHNTRVSENRKNKGATPVVGINKNGETLSFPSMQEAGRNGFSAWQIWACCEGRQRSHKGYNWRRC